MAATAVREMREAVHRRGGGRRILDLYAGVGSLGLSIAGPSASLRCVEVTPSAAAPFTRSAAAARTDRVDASLEICSAAETPEDWLGAPWDLVIVDPPRKGLEGGLREALCRAEGVETLMYLSCGFPALERDLEALHAGGWRVAEASGFLFFPGTDHLETLVVMERA